MSVMTNLLITGGCGFIGGALVRRLLREPDVRVLNLDKVTYAANPDALSTVARDGRYEHARVDICDASAVAAALQRFQPEAVLHLAAESHVDRSIDSPQIFLETNVLGTFQMLQAARRHRDQLKGAARDDFRFVHISTDEVFGSLSMSDPPFVETTPYSPNSPYSASKAASDHLVRAWRHTYGLPILVVNCSNNYGPWQFPEKLIPLIITKLVDRQPLPVYGRGENIRDWLFVDDHAEALLTVLRRGLVGETYVVGGRAERQNIDVVRTLCALMDKRRPEHSPHERLISYVTDRPGHDLRYAIAPDHIETQLGWRPSVTFEQGIERTLDWYLANEPWWRGILASRYDGARLGAAAPKQGKKS